MYVLLFLPNIVKNKMSPSSYKTLIELILVEDAQYACFPVSWNLTIQQALFEV